MVSTGMNRPANIVNGHLEFLDSLRESGSTNMFAAVPNIEDKFLVDRNEARGILKYWMDTFGDESR